MYKQVIEDNKMTIEFDKHELKVEQDDIVDLAQRIKEAIGTDTDTISGNALVALTRSFAEMVCEIHKRNRIEWPLPDLSMSFAIGHKRIGVTMYVFHETSSSNWKFSFHPVNYMDIAEIILKAYEIAAVLEKASEFMTENIGRINLPENNLKVVGHQVGKSSYRGRGKVKWAFMAFEFEYCPRAWAKIYVNNDGTIKLDESKARTKTAQDNAPQTLTGDPPSVPFAYSKGEWDAIVDYIKKNNDIIAEDVQGSDLNKNRVRENVSVTQFVMAKESKIKDAAFAKELNADSAFVAVHEGLVGGNDSWLLTNISKPGYNTRDEVWAYNMNSGQIKKLDSYSSYHRAEARRILEETIGSKYSGARDITNYGTDNYIYRFRDSIFIPTKDFEIDDFTENLIKNAFKDIVMPQMESEDTE